MLATTLRPLMLATALAFGMTAMPANAQNALTELSAYAGTLLSISASAEASRAPDIATMSTGVVTQGADANTAMRANAEQMTKVMAAIKAAGIAEKDVQTSGINLSPNYKYAENQPPVITGYQASNNVNIKVRDLGKLGKVLDALVASGANQINGPSFEIDQPEAVYDQARRAALEKARARAEMYAKELGLKVRRIVSIDEGGGYVRPTPYAGGMRMMAMAKEADTPISAGENTLSASLNVVFELGR